MAIAERKGNAAETLVARVRMQELLANEEIEALLHLLEEIAATEGWQHGGELRTISGRSAYFGLWADTSNLLIKKISGAEAGGELVGGLYLARPDDAGNLACKKLWPEIHFGPGDGIAHIAVLAVRKDWRGKKGDLGAACFWMLIGALWRYCIENGITDLWLEATPTMLRCYRLLGWPLQVRGPLRSHWGENCYPCSLSLRETAGALVEKALRSRTYRRIIENALGTGTDQRSGATSPTA